MAKIYLKDNPLKRRDSIPTFMVIDGDSLECYDQRTDRHYSDGWRDLVTPEFDEKLQYLGAIIFDSDSDVGTYEVLNKTIEQIEAEAMQQAQQAQQEAMQDFLKAQITEQAQGMDDNETLENQSLFPFWREGMPVTDGTNETEVTKVQDFNEENELVLYKCITAHTTQSDWRPKDTPALWVRVAQEGEYLVWVQPTGAHDAYMIGDIVWFPELNTTIYISNVDYNVYPPLVVQGQWSEYTSKQSAVFEIKTKKK